MHREDVLLHFFRGLSKELVGVRLIGSGRISPLGRLSRLLVFLPRGGLRSGFLFLLVVVVTGVQLAESNLYVGTSLRIYLVGSWVELLHLWSTRYHRQFIL